MNSKASSRMFIRLRRTLSRQPLFTLVLIAVYITGVIKCYRWWLFADFKSIATRSSKIQEKCTAPQVKIVFLKTHKTGSSTITNILNRLAETRNLTMALPTDGFQNFLWPLPFQADFVQNRGLRPNILSNHVRFNPEPLMKLMPAATKYVTILRHPSTQFPSLFKFMDLGGLMTAKGDQKWNISLQYFLNNAFKILKTLNQHNSQMLVDNPSLYLLRNPQLFDLGFDLSLSENVEKILETIAAISRKFSLVLITEYFDESLVLLKRRMCWSLNDVVYFKHNQQIAGRKMHSTASFEHKILQWSKADAMLYDYFNESLWSQIRNEEPGFWDEVALLRKKNGELSKVCLQTGIFLDSPYSGSTAIIYGHSLKHNISNNFKATCKRMVRSEIKYIEHFRAIYQRL